MLEALKAYVAKLEEVLNYLSEHYDVSTEELEEAMYEFAVSAGDDTVCNAANSIAEQGIEFLESFAESIEFQEWFNECCEEGDEEA